MVLGRRGPVLERPGLAVREGCVRSTGSLFRKLLFVRCSPHLSHRDEPGRSPLNAVCYMWWDTMPVYGGPVLADRQALHLAALETMAKILKFDSLACQESALHGLGHWYRIFPQQIDCLIDEFLLLHADARQELLTYARSAGCGCVL
jgi:hypothetical protein